ncbi:sel1 repeat family protein [Iodobacter sp. CM08]|uniref:SEL1-like repeat protein n=1 Tax=Iodobacter sp. CM08 TaxID=3085902 RepID=UPI00298246B2|nr:sel1 repeat family protein [Iodobacter sp. CM08]MDW5416215.1 sel1 repeat family protein [Iodobacter sp. CM08]
MSAHIYCFVLFAALALTACGNDFKDRKLDSLDNIKAKLAFTCAYEKDHLPDLPAEADILFKYARFLEKYNTQKQDEGVFAEIERLYRIATANGHYKASINLQNGMMRRYLHGSSTEMADWAEELIKANIPAGYFLMGLYIKNGSAGIKKDPELALRYFRKAADLGNPDAQYYVGDKLAPIDIAPDVARQMHQCAADQGHGEAAMDLGFNFQLTGNFVASAKAFQLGIIAGNSTTASFLRDAFKAPSPDDPLNYLALEKDDERSSRYEKIWRMLANYSFANPKVPELDQIVPLPPAKLPKWDGTFQWLKEYQAKVAPEKPSDELIAKLAKAKGLDPASGMPLAQLKKAEVAPLAPASITTPSRVALGTLCHNGLPCPEAGLWVGYFEGQKYSHLLSKGQLMPTIPASIPRSNKLAQWLKGPEKMELAMEWKLEKYTDA